VTFDQEQIWTLADQCLSCLGEEGFVSPALEFVRALGADQVMVFSYEPDRAACLLSRNYTHEPTATKLAADYLDEWFKKDPLYPLILNLPLGAVQIHSLSDLRAGMDAAYQEWFYGQPDLADKTAVLVAGKHLRLILNLYRHGSSSGAVQNQALLSVLGRLMLAHFEARTDSGVPPALAALSERERAVCLGILNGKKAEMIAGDLQVAPSTVVTYRKRAYEKLGISSRADLFAICRA